MKPLLHKTKNKNRLLFTFLFCICCNFYCSAQDESITEKETDATEIVKISYHCQNNSIQYLLLKAVLKKGKEQTPVKNKSYTIYLNSATDDFKIASLTTDNEGKAKTFLPPSLKEVWNTAPQHTFIVKSGDEDIIDDYSITKSKITIDTSTTDGVHRITVTILRQDNNNWVPAADVEMKVGFQRLGGILSAGEEESYTTDSSGNVTVDAIVNNLPGDTNGNILLAVKVDDNELFGNLFSEQVVPWGKKTIADYSFFNKRTLWSTRNRTPFWLLFLAYTIIISVWSTLIYLIIQLMRIRKIGNKLNKNSITE